MDSNNNSGQTRPSETSSSLSGQQDVTKTKPEESVPVKYSTDIIPLPYRPPVTPQAKLNQMQIDKQKKSVSIMLQHRPHHILSRPIRPIPDITRPSSTSKLDAAINNLKNSSTNGFSRQSTSSHTIVDNPSKVIHSPSIANNGANPVVVCLPPSSSVNSMAKPSSSSEFHFRNKAIRSSPIPHDKNTPIASPSYITSIKLATKKEVQLSPVSKVQPTPTGVNIGSSRNSPAFFKQRSFIKITPKRKSAAQLNMEQNPVRKEPVRSITGGNADTHSTISSSISLVKNGSNEWKVEPVNSKQGATTDKINIPPLCNLDGDIPKTKELLDAVDRAGPSRLYYRSSVGTFTKVTTSPSGDTLKKTKANANNTINIPFIWNDYLKATKSIAAPLNCFNQSQNDITCKFEIGMKLETRDPRNLSAWCLATVIRREGIRIQLRLDGSGNSNDIWRLIDSADNRPVGSGGQEALAPPVGFISCCSSYSKWFEKRIAKPGTVLAPENCFEPEPAKPSTNLFKKGMKLEAVDLKNTYLICPATIGDVRGHEISVVFDGWKGSFDYKCSYDSRDIFPVGWCERTGYTLQRPGNWPSILHIYQKSEEPGLIDLDEYRTPEGTPTDGHEKKKKISFQEPIEEVLYDISCTRTTPIDKLNLSKRQKPSDNNETMSQNKSFDALKPLSTPSAPSDVTTNESHYDADPTINIPPSSITDDSDVSFSITAVTPKKRKKMESKSTSISPASNPKLSNLKEINPGPSNNDLSTYTADKPKIVNDEPSQSVNQSQTGKTDVSTLNTKDNELSIYRMTVENVVDLIMKKDNILAKHADLFIEHEIDGKSFMLLNKECMSKDLGLMLGPILKIKNLQKELVENKFRPDPDGSFVIFD